MKVTWTKLAKQDLERIHFYIAKDDKTAALKVISRIYNSVHTQLVIAPLSGREGRVKTTRELVLSDIPYIITYRVVDEEIQIVRVLHTSLQWPEKF